MKEQYIVYIGDEIIECFDNVENAKVKYNTLPSGKGKRPSLRRQLVKEQTIIQDER
jgi:hypothetical protein